MARRAVAGMAGIAALCAGALAMAYETDPYTNRHIDIADSLRVLDVKVNATLDEIAAKWSRGEDEWAFVTAVYRRLGGLHWVDKLERWAMNNAEVEKLPISRRESLIRDFPLRTSRVASLFGFGPTIKVAGVHLGTDKIGHFFSQGRKFYRRYRRLGDEARAARRSVTTEAGLFGQFTTGVFSNADLVANYEGYLFYRGLFHDAVVGGKPALFYWRHGRPLRRRWFTWADHVNAFWDEALNPNDYARALLPHVTARLLRLCEDHARRPERYRVDDAEALRARYRHAGLRDNRWLCPDAYLTANCPPR